MLRSSQMLMAYMHPSSMGDSSIKPEFLANIFDDVPEFAAMVPSPPPLPLDFHINSLPAPNRMLFNFGQFNQKMPHALAPGVAARELSDREVLDLAEQHVVYDHTDDGELMQMLFGMADEVPTMATIHLHTWHNVDNEQEEGLAGGVGQVAGEVQEQAEGSSGPEGLGSQLGKGKGKGKAAKAKPAPQPGRWLDRDCNAALNMQRIEESRWRPLELCYWPDRGALPAKGKEYPGLGYKRLLDKPPKAQQQHPAAAQ
ncbi:uncharacterized protein HaLaN_15814 [Haematococcus lacustris]|uniref:Uncharacterized protein n=1 Tax=Haematococcus lacustris TaxID=44745 RepID=A0A699ZIL9_HAELA|nr:uncharacterized protein HaLaN_15814 [Haematococcus lacustris]